MDKIIWQYALVILLVINIGSLSLSKLVSNKLPQKKSQGIFFQYLFCAIIAIVYFFLWEKGAMNPAIFLIGIIGFINCFGLYFQWKAFEISLSKSVLFLPLMELIAMSLGVMFLGEVTFWNIQLLIGAGLCFLAITIFRLPKKEKMESLYSKKLILFILGMVLIFGTASFLMKSFSLTVSRGNFLMGWYVGAFFGTLLLLILEKQNPFKIPLKTVLLIFPLSLLVSGTIFALYWTYQLGGPISLVSPIKGLFVTAIPIFVGWLIFKEIKGLSKKDLIGFVIGIIGAILVLTK